MAAINPTYRVSGLPSGCSRQEAVSILQAFLDTDHQQTEPEVHSLGYDAYEFGRAVDMVATVTFGKIPEWFNTRLPQQFSTGKDISKAVTFRKALITVTLAFDKDFLGFTPLNDVKDDENHQIEYARLYTL